MAKSKDGLFGKLSGKVGNLVFATWKGVPYVRSRPSGNPSNTKAQQTQRSKFGMIVKFVGRILPVIKAGFKRKTDEMPERNAAISFLMKNAARGEKPDLWIDYAEVKIARGNLPAPKEAKVELSADNNLVVQWTHNDDLDEKRGTDKALVLAYSPKIEQGVWSIDGTAVRSDEALTVELSDTGAQKELHVYLAFADSEGNDASDSVYLGRV